MKLKSNCQKDIYDINTTTGQIKVTKPDGKFWYMPIMDARMIVHVMKKKEQMELIKGELGAIEEIIEL